MDWPDFGRPYSLEDPRNVVVPAQFAMFMFRYNFYKEMARSPRNAQVIIIIVQGTFGMIRGTFSVIRGTFRECDM